MIFHIRISNTCLPFLRSLTWIFHKLVVFWSLSVDVLMSPVSQHFKCLWRVVEKICQHRQKWTRSWEISRLCRRFLLRYDNSIPLIWIGYNDHLEFFFLTIRLKISMQLPGVDPNDPSVKDLIASLQGQPEVRIVILCFLASDELARLNYVIKPAKGK